MHTYKIWLKNLHTLCVLEGISFHVNSLKQQSSLKIDSLKVEFQGTHFKGKSMHSSKELRMLYGVEVPWFLERGELQSNMIKIISCDLMSEWMYYV